MEATPVKWDNEVLEYEFNKPAMLSSLSFNSVDQQHTPKPFDKIKSTPASGNYFRTPADKVFLGPAPRSQLGVPTNKVYTGNRSKYYKSIISNANWVRGNQFGVDYPYKKKDKFREVVKIPSTNLDRKNIDYLGNDAKIVMRNNDPFYPYPSLHLRKDKDYWGYMHEKQYVNGEPIYNYPYSLQEGVARGKYYGGKDANPCDPYNVNERCEGFCCGNDTKVVEEYFEGCKSCDGVSWYWIVIILIIFVVIAMCLGKKIR